MRSKGQFSELICNEHGRQVVLEMSVDDNSCTGRRSVLRRYGILYCIVYHAAVRNVASKG